MLFYLITVHYTVIIQHPAPIVSLIPLDRTSSSSSPFARSKTSESATPPTILHRPRAQTRPTIQSLHLRTASGRRLRGGLLKASPRARRAPPSRQQRREKRRPRMGRVRRSRGLWGRRRAGNSREKGVVFPLICPFRLDWFAGGMYQVSFLESLKLSLVCNDSTFSVSGIVSLNSSPWSWRFSTLLSLIAVVWTIVDDYPS